MPSFFEQAYKPGSVYAAIYLGRLLPDASSHLPKTDRASPAPWGAVFLPVLLWIEFTGSPSYLGDRWALTPPFHRSRAVSLCCTCPEVAFGGCYPLSCPIKPGLSSYTAFRHCARGCSAYSDSYYTHSVPSLSSGGPVSGRPSGAAAPGNKAKAGCVR